MRQCVIERVCSNVNLGTFHQSGRVMRGRYHVHTYHSPNRADSTRALTSKTASATHCVLSRIGIAEFVLSHAPEDLVVGARLCDRKRKRTIARERKRAKPPNSKVTRMVWQSLNSKSLLEIIRLHTLPLTLPNRVFPA
jgi:hypothetical protein